MSRQPFEEFLNTPGPSRYRDGPVRGQSARGGRGRGARGVQPSFRGSHGRDRPVRSFNSDYSNVAFDYQKVNKQQYSKTDGFVVAPFGPGNPQSQPSATTLPNRPPKQQRQRFRQSNGHGFHQNATPSGSATPVTGLGFHGQGHSFANGLGETPDRAGFSRGGPNGRHTSGETVGRSGVTWGGGAAPMFVKGGELFKDLEILDPEQLQQTVPAIAIPSASTPALGLPSNRIPVFGGPVFPDAFQPIADAQSANAEVEILQWNGAYVSPAGQTSTFQASRYREEVTYLPNPIASSFVQPSLPSTQQQGPPRQTHQIPDRPPPAATYVPTVTIDTVGDNDLRTSPEPDINIQNLRQLSISPENRLTSDDEQIVFTPADPPRAVTPQESRSNEDHSSAPQPPIISRVFVNPHQMTRREKKSLKKDKRGRVKRKKKNTRKAQAYEGSDLDWGSDGPPVEILDVVDAAEAEEVDVAILRDYLAGTLLNAQESGTESEGSKSLPSFTRGNEDDREVIEILSSGEEDNPDPDDSASVQEIFFVADSDSSSESESVEEITEAQVSLPKRQARKARFRDDGNEPEHLDDLFHGRDSWGETQWFIRNMEEALDNAHPGLGARGSRNAVFSAVENGDFGDDWGQQPARKGRKKANAIPVELRGQWEKDRQKKAEKKRQRELDRLVAEISPFHSTRASRRKINGKTAAEMEKARLAHLIPASASQVAEMFDVSTDDDAVPTRKMAKMANLILDDGAMLPGLDVGIRQFLGDEGRTTYSLPPMSKEGRQKAHILAEGYGLKSKSKGKDKDRFTIFFKTARSGQMIDEDKINRILAAAPFTGGQFYKALRTRPRDPNKKKKGPGDRGASARMRDGEAVGEGAERIGMENIGHRLLSQMGWAEGGRIGRSDGGLDNPIVAIVKNTKMGLGA